MTGQLRLLGTPTFVTAQEPLILSLRRPSALLFYLAVRADWVSREELMYLFDPDVGNSEAARKLRIQLYRAKQLGWSQGIESKGKQMRWRVESDLTQFWQAVQTQSWQTASQLYTGELLQGLSLKNTANYQTWLEHERSRLQEAWVKASLNYAQHLKEQARFSDAIALLKPILLTDPFNEKVVRLIMELRQLSGERTKALSTFEVFHQQLEAELGLEPQEETKQLAIAIQENGPSFETNPPTLPLPQTPFIGREFEMADVVKQFENPDCHLMCIVGPGGCGKTRLALQAALELNPRFQQGSHFVSLASVNSAGLIPSILAEHFGIKLSGQGAAMNELINYLREKNLLLVLDNLEHLLSDLSWLIKLLESCPRLFVIVTSRERLKLPAEQLLAIQGLPYPKDEQEGHTHEAIKLFKEAAKRVGKETFSVEDDQHAIQICQQVEGNPLAIELVASWLRALTVKQLSEELTESFDVLSESYRNLASHHENPRAVFNHSWNLLNEKERRALSALSIFPSSFSLDAAKKVTGIHLPVLFSLIDKSLLRHQESYSFHELIHFYSFEKLTLKKRKQLEESYLHYYADFLANRELALRSDKQLDALSEISHEFGNIRTFWDLALKHQNVDVLSLALGAWVDSYSLKSYFAEGAELLAKSSEIVQEGVLYHRIQARQGRFLMRLGNYDEAKPMLEKNLTFFKQNDHAGEASGVLLTLGTIARNQGDLAASESYYQEGLGYARRESDSWREALAINNLGIVFYRQGKSEKAKEHYEQSLHLFRKANANWATTLPLNNLGILSFLKGDLANAKRYFGENIPTFDLMGDTKGKALSLSNLGTIAYEEAEYEQAKAYHQQSLALSQDIGERWAIANDLANLGFTYTKLAELGEAKRSFLAALQRSQELGAPPMLLYVLAGLAELEYKQGNKEVALRQFVFVENHSASNKAVQDRCQKLIKALHISKAALKKAGKGAAGLKLEMITQHYMNFL